MNHADTGSVFLTPFVCDMDGLIVVAGFVFGDVGLVFVGALVCLYKGQP